MDACRVTSAPPVHPFSFIAFILMVLAVEYIIVTVVECGQKVRTSVWVLPSSLRNDAEEFFIQKGFLIKSIMEVLLLQMDSGLD